MHNYYRSCLRFLDEIGKAKNLSEQHAGASSDLIKLLRDCLQMNPSNRPKIDSLLDNPVFSEIRDKSREMMTTASQKVEIKMDKIKVSEGDLVDYSEVSLVKYVIRYSQKIRKYSWLHRAGLNKHRGDDLK